MIEIKFEVSDKLLSVIEMLRGKESVEDYLKNLIIGDAENMVEELKREGRKVSTWEMLFIKKVEGE